MNYAAINLDEKFGLFTEQWQPKVIAEMNDSELRVRVNRKDPTRYFPILS
jgi:hypothetical protein